MEDKISIAAVTIGQSPRDDLTPELKDILGEKCRIIEYGALDGYNFEEISTKFAAEAGEEVLVSRMRDGREVIFAEKYIVELVNEKLKLIEDDDIDLILLLCTGRFENLESQKILIQPQKIIYNLIKNILFDKKMALIIPDQSQKGQIKKYWSEFNITPIIEYASPYRDEKYLMEAAENLKNSEAELIYLDCMGYSKEMKEIVKKITNKRVILPREMIAFIIKGLF